MTDIKPLSGKQKRHLRGLAHSLSPLVQIGKQGLNDAVAAQVSTALLAHELIKVKLLQEAPCDIAEASAFLKTKTGAHEAQKIGRTLVLFLSHPEKPTIHLPKA